MEKLTTGTGTPETMIGTSDLWKYKPNLEPDPAKGKTPSIFTDKCQHDELQQIALEIHLLGNEPI